MDKVYGSTSKGQNIYLHIQDPAAFAGCTVPLAGYRVLGCSYQGEMVAYTQDGDSLKITSPAGLPKQADTIIRLQVDRPVEPKKDAEVYFTGK